MSQWHNHTDAQSATDNAYEMPTIPEPSARERKVSGYVLKQDKPATGNTRRFVASDEEPDRMGDVVKVKGWKLENFEANPVILLRHGMGTTPEFALPIGKAVGLRKRMRASPRRLDVDIEFLSEHPLSDTAVKMIDKGLMGVSVGFRPEKWDWRTEKVAGTDNETAGVRIIGREFQEQELVEISLTATPANPRALRRGLEEMVTKGDLSWDELEKGMEEGLFTQDVCERVLELKPKFFDQEKAYAYILRDMKRFKDRSIRRFLWKNELPRVFGESGFLVDEERGALHRLIFPKGDGWSQEEAEQYVEENAERIKEFKVTIEKEVEAEQVELQTLLSFCRDVEEGGLDTLKEYIVPLAKQRIEVLEEELFPSPVLETSEETAVDDGKTTSSHEVDETRVRSVVEKMDRLIEDDRQRKLLRVAAAIQEANTRINS